MPSLRSSKKKQTRLTFPPLPSSSPQAATYSSNINKRAAAVKLENIESPTKKRRLRNVSLDAASKTSHAVGTDSGRELPSTKKELSTEDHQARSENADLGLPTPEPSSQVLQTEDIKDELEISWSSSSSSTTTIPARQPSTNIFAHRKSVISVEPEPPKTPRNVPTSRDTQRSDTSTRRSGKVKKPDTESEDEDILIPNRHRRVNKNKDVSTISDDESEGIVPLSRPKSDGTRSRSRRDTLRNNPKRRQSVSLSSHPLKFVLGGSSGTAPISSSYRRKIVTPAESRQGQQSSRGMGNKPKTAAGPTTHRRSARIARRSFRPVFDFDPTSDDSEPKYIKQEASIAESRDFAPLNMAQSRSDEDSDVVLPSPRRLRRSAQRRRSSHIDGSASTDSDVIIVSATKNKSLVHPTTPSVSPSKPHSYEVDEDLQEDLEALKDTEVRRRRTRGRAAQSKRTEATKQLAMLKAQREGKMTIELSSDSEYPRIPARAKDGSNSTSDQSNVSEISEDEEANEAIRQSLLNDDDEYEQDFVDDDDAGVLGEPPAGWDEMPLEFTRHAHKKAKAHFKDAVEWMVHRKLNPAFPRDDPVYQIAFHKLDDEVKGYSGSKFLSAAWTGDFARAIRARPNLEEIAVPTMFEHKCDACNRSGHPAKFRITFNGKAYNPETLENLSDDEDDKDDDAMSLDRNGQPLPPVDKEYFIGRFCKANATTAHSLLHWRWHLNDWVLDYLTHEGHTSPEKIIERESWSTKKRTEYANKVVDEMEEKGEIRDLYHDFKINLDQARNFKPPRFRDG